MSSGRHFYNWLGEIVAASATISVLRFPLASRWGFRVQIGLLSRPWPDAILETAVGWGKTHFSTPRESICFFKIAVGL